MQHAQLQHSHQFRSHPFVRTLVAKLLQNLRIEDYDTGIVLLEYQMEQHTASPSGERDPEGLMVPEASQSLRCCCCCGACGCAVAASVCVSAILAVCIQVTSDTRTNLFPGQCIGRLGAERTRKCKNRIGNSDQEPRSASGSAVHCLQCHSWPAAFPQDERKHAERLLLSNVSGWPFVQGRRGVGAGAATAAAVEGWGVNPLPYLCIFRCWAPAPAYLVADSHPSWN